MSMPLDNHTPMTTTSGRALQYVIELAEAGADLCMVPVRVGIQDPIGDKTVVILALFVDGFPDHHSFVLKISEDGTWMCMLLTPNELLVKH